jgi:predicted transcriptional regulator
MARHRGTGTSNRGSWLNWPWIPGNELHERRKQVIRLHKRKFGVMQIVELTGLSWPAVRTAIDLYEAGGLAAIKPKDRGKKSREGRILTPDQEAHIQKLIVGKAARAVENGVRAVDAGGGRPADRD